jgi:dihydrofolate reductase
MAKLIYGSNMSLDGWTEDERGAFDWAPPDDGVFAFITQLMRSAGTYLYGRRMYETLAVWETDSTRQRSQTSWPTTPAHGRRRTRSFTPRP